MPVQEEVDEINEFLQKRREKQRLGELPKEDITPAFAKKISLAIFGKPRTEVKPLLKSTQPTYASTQAQEAMRQQLDEIMETRPTKTFRPAYSAPTPTPSSSSTIVSSRTIAAKPPTASPSLPSAQSFATPKPPGVPKYYSDMPYPPYIQRGLSNYPEKKTPASSVAPPSKPSSKSSSTFQERESPPLVTRTYSHAPMSAPVQPLSSPSISTAKSTPPIYPIQTTRATSPLASTRPSSPSTISPPPAARFISPTPTTKRSTDSSIISSPASVISADSSTVQPVSTTPESFWKKFLGGKKQTPLSQSLSTTPSSRASGIPPISKPSPYVPIPTIVSQTNRPPSISSIPPVDSTSSSIKQSSSASTPPIVKTSSPNSLLPAATPLPPAVVSPSFSPFPLATATASSIVDSTVIRREKKDVIENQRQQRAELLSNLSPTPSSSGDFSSIPISKTILPSTTSEKNVPPWVSRTAIRETAPQTTPILSSPSSNSITSPYLVSPISQPDAQHENTLPWKQPFGTGDAHDSSSQKKSTTLSPNEQNKTNQKSFSTKEESLSNEVSFNELEKENTRASHEKNAALEEEISEEEALEKLPFEEVEGLSESDLDYLSKKEKEHRAAQEKEDGDLGNPSELKSTLQRQSTQLEGALHENQSPNPDEKQEILRRLKKMMEDEGHP